MGSRQESGADQREIIQRIQEAEAAMGALIAQSHALPFCTAFVTRELPQCWEANHVVHVRELDGMAAEEAYRQVETLYLEHGVTCFKWMFSAGAESARWKAYLVSLGWRRRVNQFYLLKESHGASPVGEVEIVPMKSQAALAREFLRDILISEGHSDESELEQVLTAAGRQMQTEQVQGFLACREGRAVGLLRYFFHGPMCYISDLDVCAEWRRHGIGRALLHRAIQEGKGREITLYTAADNAPAIALYERTGFECLGVADAYYPSRAGV